MNKGVGARIREAREAASLKQSELATACGVHWVTVSKWEKDRQSPEKHLQALAKALSVGVNWLLTGERQKRYVEVATRVEDVWGAVQPPAKIVKFKEAELVAVPERNELKVFGKVAADKNIAFAEAIETVWADSRFKSKDHYGLVVHGRSMHPTIFEGDHVVCQSIRLELEPFDPMRGPANKADWKKLNELVVCACVDGGDALVKRLYVYDSPKKAGGFLMLLQSDNRGVAPIPIFSETRLEIVGIVREIMRNPKNFE